MRYRRWKTVFWLTLVLSLSFFDNSLNLDVHAKGGYTNRKKECLI